MAEQTGGYDYEFVEAPSKNLFCNICQYPSKEPHLSVCCGHTFCKSCLEAAKRAKSISSACPMCRTEDFVTFFNKQTDRDIKNLHVYCSNKEKGCEWQGELNAITGHLTKKDGCQFQKVNCPNNCKVACERRDLTNHVETECPCRKVSCQYCHDTGEHQFIMGQHKEECPKIPVPCPNNCEVGTILLEDMKKHMSECHLEVIECLNNCGAKIERWRLFSHVETECPHRNVNCDYCHYTGEHQFIEGQHKEECPKLPQPCPYKCGVGSIPRDELTKHTERCSLGDIQCKYHIVGCEAILARKDHEEHNKKMVEEHLSLFLSELAVTKTSVEKNFREQLLATIEHHTQEITHGLTENITKHKEKMEKYHKDLEVVQQELQATKEQTKRFKNIIWLMLILILMFLLHYAKLQNVESEPLKTKISELEIQHDITELIKDQITQRLEENCNSTKLQTDDTFNNDALVAKVHEDISAINRTALEGISAVNKTAIEGISAVNKTALEGISAVNKTALEGISAVNKTALEGISDLKAQLPFVYCSFSYPSFYDELITKADKSQFNSSNAPVIVKISGISDALGSSCSFYQEVYVINLYGDTIKLLLYKYNNTHMLIRLYNQECSIHKYQVWFNLFTVRLMNQVTDSDHYKLNLLSEDFWVSDEIQTTVHCSLNQLFSFGSIYKMTRTTQYIGCDTAFFSVDHPDFYKWF